MVAIPAAIEARVIVLGLGDLFLVVRSLIVDEMMMIAVVGT